MKSTAIALAGAFFLLVQPATAEDGEAPAAPPAARKAPKATSAATVQGEPAATVRRDPAGVKGISPFWEALAAGDRAYVARDYEAALSAYRKAVTQEPRAALGHLRMAEVQLKQENLEAAEEAAAAGLRFAGDDGTLQGKALFLLAQIRERQSAYDAALQAWDAYEAHAKAQPKAKTYPGTAAERKQRVSTRKQMVADYAVVKERIEQRLKEVDEQTRKNAK